MPCSVYILRTKNDRLYIGQTNNLDSRTLRHKDGKGARFIKDNGTFFDVLYFEDYCTRAEAMRREKQLKRWTRAKKEALICSRDSEPEELYGAYELVPRRRIHVARLLKNENY